MDTTSAYRTVNPRPPRSLKGTATPPASVSAADIERLRYALGRRRVDLQHSLYGPGSMTWRINRERALLLGGGRALLLQVAHPLVAAGVVAHSSFRQRPLQRLWRTLDLMLTITFASAVEAIRAVREIERVHARVRGTLDTKVRPFARGTPYAAADPQLLLWVYATLVDTSLLVYERVIAPLTDAEKTAYYKEAKIGFRLFGVPERLLPSTCADFVEYVHEAINGPTLAVGPASREIAAAILYPPLPFGVRHVVESLNLFTIGLLPPGLRLRYGFGWGSGREVLLNGVATATQRLLPWLPGIARYFPQARRAIRRDQRRAGKITSITRSPRKHH
jgi:uncharacterized protein (DUF2236 family)